MTENIHSEETLNRASHLRAAGDAVQKRRSARSLNALLLDGGRPPSRDKLDGRVERRRGRLLRELEAGARESGKAGVSELKPVEVLSHADELLALGTPWAAVKKAAGTKYRARQDGPKVVEAARAVQGAYAFDARVWELIGITLA